MTNIINMTARKGLSFRIGSDIDNTQVNAQGPFDINGIGIINIASCQKVEIAPKQNQVTLSLLAFEQFPLSIAANKRYLDSAFKRPDRNDRVVKIVTQQPGVISNATGYFERSFGLFVQLVRVGNFGDATHRHLSRQVKLLTNIVIDQLVNLKLAKSLVIPGNLADVVASFICRFKRLSQKIGLFFGW